MKINNNGNTVAPTNMQVKKYVVGAMADVTVEARGKLRYLQECQSDRAKEMEEAVQILDQILFYVTELQTLDD